MITTVFVLTRLPKTEHPRKRFQTFRQSYTSCHVWKFETSAVLNLTLARNSTEVFSTFSTHLGALFVFFVFVFFLVGWGRSGIHQAGKSVMKMEA